MIMSDETAVAVDSGEPVGDPLTDIIEQSEAASAQMLLAEVTQLRARVTELEDARVAALRAAVGSAIHHGWCDAFADAIVASGYTSAEVEAMSKITVEVAEVMELNTKEAAPASLRSTVGYRIRAHNVKLVVRLGDGSIYVPLSTDNDDDDD